LEPCPFVPDDLLIHRSSTLLVASYPFLRQIVAFCNRSLL
jgi:hypothetical protein